MQEILIRRNRFLKTDTAAFYSANFYGYGQANNPDCLNTLKNDNHHKWATWQLDTAKKQVMQFLAHDLFEIVRSHESSRLTICVVPRAKKECTYRPNQLLFKSAVCETIRQLYTVEDGTGYIRRHTDTKTTHLKNPMPDYVNAGALPYPGITRQTCHIASEVKWADILLIDDIYTPTINIDEDAIQALMDAGANSVTFYAVAKTVGRY